MNQSDVKAIYSTATSDKQKRISWIANQSSRYHSFWKPDLQRINVNSDMYWSVDFGQWPAEVVEQLKKEGRRPPTIPVIPDKIETLVGSTIANGFDISIQSRTTDYDDESILLTDLMMADSNVCDWESAEIQATLDSCIYCGYERMRITDKFSPFGNIAFERLNPKRILIDPTWRDNDVNSIRSYFYWDDLTVTQIMEAFPKAKSSIEYLREREMSEGEIEDEDTFTEDTGEEWTFEKKWGSKHRVWEFHSIRRVSGMAEYDLVNQTFFPESGYAPGSDEDKTVKLEYAKRNGLTPDDICLLKRERTIKMIEVVCPTLSKSIMLSSGPDPVQCGNCNIFPLGLRYDGQVQGFIVDRMYDLQMGINKAEMLIQDTMTRSAKGAFMLDSALAGNDPVVKQQIEDSWNDPAAKMWLDEFSTKNLPNGGIIKLPGSEVSNDSYQNLSRYYQLSDQFSKVNAAMDGRSESSKESGKLFQAKFEAGQISQKFLFKILEKHKRSKIASYIEQAKIQYAGIEMIALKNAKSKTFEDIKTFDITRIAPMNVVVIPSPRGISLRNNKVAEYRDIMSLMIGPDDGLLRYLALEEVVYLSELDEAKREEFSKAFQLVKLNAAVQLQARIVQGQAMIQQSQQPPMPPQAAQGGEPQQIEQQPEQPIPQGA